MGGGVSPWVQGGGSHASAGSPLTPIRRRFAAGVVHTWGVGVALAIGRRLTPGTLSCGPRRKAEQAAEPPAVRLAHGQRRSAKVKVKAANRG
jgi:hypothetical protein